MFLGSRRTGLGFLDRKLRPSTPSFGGPFLLVI